MQCAVYGLNNVCDLGFSKKALGIEWNEST